MRGPTDVCVSVHMCVHVCVCVHVHTQVPPQGLGAAKISLKHHKSPPSTWINPRARVCVPVHAPTCEQVHACVPTPRVHRRPALTTEMLASPMAGVVPALQTTPSPWHTAMAVIRLMGCVAAFTSVSPLPHAAAATSQKKVKQTVTQKSCRDGDTRLSPSAGTEQDRISPVPSPGAQPPYRYGELLIRAVEGMKAQVKHQSCHGVEEGEDRQGHKKLGGSGEITNEVQGADFRLALTVRHHK